MDRNATQKPPLRWNVMRMKALAACAALLTLAISPMGPSALRAESIYSASAAEIVGAPGSIIRAEMFKAPPGASSAYRILYRSRSGKNQPIAVSGVVVIPERAAPAGGRPIVSWAHATSGIAQSCARSMYPSLYTHMYGLQDMLARGFVVAATDYPGLGTSGTHPYLIGVDQGRAVLDMARAARALPAAEAGATFAVAGYSQGGHASLYAGKLAKSYAPELKLVGIAASAPPTDLAALVREADADPIGKVFLTYALASWSKLYGLPLEGVIDPRVRLVVNNIGRSCNMTFAQGMRLLFAEQAYEREGFFKEDVDFTTIAAWKSLLAKNSPGPTPAGIPVFLAQGRSDNIVRPEVTQAYAAKLCARGTRVTLVPIKGGHNETGPLAAAPMVEWLGNRFAGRAAPSDCGATTDQVVSTPRENGRSSKAAALPAKSARGRIPPEKRFDLV
ncbi:MAG TPA: alpha/beta fold hydrolase, partial [Caulobacteraceae bacterium]|nr:alpha/beta fold hydrolase [Caulobacteraceae bacterium]